MDGPARQIRVGFALESGVPRSSTRPNRPLPRQGSLIGVGRWLPFRMERHPVFLSALAAAGEHLLGRESAQILGPEIT
eukprot:CAMPEP_0204126828 /NCGR_PEP_ID=MMETSP0361-20130328/11236_1 /ASSEMBLY_ACC=CAM_ASM_000343 /TAXON_ID=268821 /ORGANISM="Scrippsiella Hangoei, Strain SHTV-5" /LENGTH=77 /DNA_ID=CAMNT_0051078773 /DNA_START=133 /DNA_END=362 /DNA_ORIENTATION=-